MSRIRLIASFVFVAYDLQANILKSTTDEPIFRFKNDLPSNEAWDVYPVSITSIRSMGNSEIFLNIEIVSLIENRSNLK